MKFNTQNSENKQQIYTFCVFIFKCLYSTIDNRTFHLMGHLITQSEVILKESDIEQLP